MMTRRSTPPAARAPSRVQSALVSYPPGRETQLIKQGRAALNDLHVALEYFDTPANNVGKLGLIGHPVEGADGRVVPVHFMQGGKFVPFLGLPSAAQSSLGDDAVELAVGCVPYHTKPCQLHALLQHLVGEPVGVPRAFVNKKKGKTGLWFVEVRANSVMQMLEFNQRVLLHNDGASVFEEAGPLQAWLAARGAFLAALPPCESGKPRSTVKAMTVALAKACDAPRAAPLPGIDGANLAFGPSPRELSTVECVLIDRGCGTSESHDANK